MLIGSFGDDCRLAMMAISVFFLQSEGWEDLGSSRRICQISVPCLSFSLVQRRDLKYLIKFVG